MKDDGLTLISDILSPHVNRDCQAMHSILCVLTGVAIRLQATVYMGVDCASRCNRPCNGTLVAESLYVGTHVLNDDSRSLVVVVVGWLAVMRGVVESSDDWLHPSSLVRDVAQATDVCLQLWPTLA